MLELNCIRACEAGASIPQLSMEDIQMKSRVLLTSIVLSLTATMAAPLYAAPPKGEPADGQVQAAALLSRAWTPVIPNTAGTISPVTASRDGHASAAALLSRPSVDVTDQVKASPSRVRDAVRSDAHARAAALLSPPRTI
jgi:hypothetical protein